MSCFEGEYVIRCSIDWDGETYSAFKGETIRLPPSTHGHCYGCGTCDEDGLQCWNLYTLDGKPYETISTFRSN